MKDIFYIIEKVTQWLNFLTSFLFFFLKQPKRSVRKQTRAVTSIIERDSFVTVPKLLPQRSNPPQTNLEQRKKVIICKLDAGNLKDEKMLTALGENIAPLSTAYYKKVGNLNTQKELM